MPRRLLQLGCLFILLHVGCRSNPNVLDPFAPYGNQCIPPPATGSLGGSGYLQPTAPRAVPPVGALAPPPVPRTSSLPDNENWSTSEEPAPLANPTASNSPAPRNRPLPAALRPSRNLAWQPPGAASGSRTLTSTPSSIQLASAQQAGTSVSIPTQTRPFPEGGYAAYDGRPVRPAAVRPPCQCDQVPGLPANLQPVPSAAAQFAGTREPSPLQWR